MFKEAAAICKKETAFTIYLVYDYFSRINATLFAVYVKLAIKKVVLLTHMALMA